MCMYQYHLIQWVLFFYVYCFLGWVWESSFVSIRKMQWVNRGFMHGPFLPIYGCGAITILLATIPVKEQIGLVFLMGMIAATLLEYVTGVLMEYLFHVRYWDYTGKPFQYKGHICLSSSLAWGGFSVLMVNVIHVPIAEVILNISDEIQQFVTFAITIVVVADFTVSFKEALDIRQLLDTLVENNEELKRIQRRIEVLAAFINEDKEQWKTNVTEKLETTKQNVAQKMEKLETTKQNVVQKIEKLETTKQNVAQKMEILKRHYEMQQQDKTDTADTKQHFEELKQFYQRLNMIENEQHFHTKLFAKNYQRAKNIMKRNALVASKKYNEALQEIKEYKELKKRK